MSFEEQIMFKDEHPRTSSRQMEGKVFIISQISVFHNMRIFGNFGLNVTQMFPSFRWNIFSHVERLAREHAGAELFDELDEQSYNLLFIFELGITHMQC